MQVSTMSGAEIRRTLTVIARGCAAAAHQRRWPGASEETAWEWADEHKDDFRDAALNIMVMLQVEEEKRAASVPPSPG